MNIGIVKLLGIETDKNLTFETHIVKLCSKAAAQLNVISRLNRYLDKSKTAVIIISFIYANFNYCPLVWHFYSCNSTRMKKSKNDVLEYY